MKEKISQIMKTVFLVMLIIGAGGGVATYSHAGGKHAVFFVIAFVGLIGLIGIFISRIIALFKRKK